MIKQVKSPESEIQTLEDSDESVGHYLYFYLLALRCLGTHPFSSDRAPNVNIRYFWKWNSFSSLYSAAVTGIMGFFIFTSFIDYFSLVVFIEDDAWLKRFGVYNASLIDGITMKIFPIINPVLSLFLILTALAQTNALILLINNWANYEKKYCQVFPLADKPFKHLRVHRNRGFVSGPVFLSLFFYVGGRLNSSSCVFPEIKDMEIRRKNENYCRDTTNFVTLSSIMSYFEDYKQILLLITCIMAFAELRASTKLQNRSALDNSFFVSRTQGPENVRKWGSLLVLIRNQIKLTGRVFSPHHLLNILALFIMFCLTAFMQVSIAMRTDDGKIRQSAFAALCLCLIGTLRLAFKASLGERLMTEEREFANDVRQIKDSGQGGDLMTRLEMTMLIDMMERRPAKIDFGGIMTLNYSLLLQMVGQVATYLVVLVQLNNMEK